jgi:predicted nucleic acid-binding protein
MLAADGKRSELVLDTLYEVGAGSSASSVGSTDRASRPDLASTADRADDVVSELMRPEPAAGVANWVRHRDRYELRTTVITLAEVRYGIARLPDGRRKQVLLAAADEAFAAFADQILPVDSAAAEHYAVIASGRERAGKPIAGFDALIAAVCRAQGAALATRNVSNFDGTGIETIDPWRQTPA